MSVNSSQNTPKKRVMEAFIFDDKVEYNDQPAFLETIEISHLFGFKNFKWRLNTDVNVLVGQNGSGKSSILKVLLNRLKYKNSPILAQVEGCDLEFQNGFYRQSKQVSAEVSQRILQKLVSNSTDESIDSVKFDKAIQLYNLYKSQGADEVCYYQSKGNFLIGDEQVDNHPKAPFVSDLITIKYLSTFDMELMSKTELDQVGKQVKTQLDSELEKELNRFASFQLALARKTRKQFSEGVKGSKSEFDKISQNNFGAVDAFESNLNSLFSDNNKSFQINDEGNIAIHENGEELALNQLSSGEKQLILILLRVTNSSNKPTIFMLDEPEISLHLSWQEKLISTIRDIHPQCQLIIVTHSPAIVMKGWMDKMVDIKEITVGSEDLAKGTVDS